MTKRLISMCLTFAVVLSMFVAIPTTTAQALTQEQLDIVARADAIYNTTWVAQKDVEGWISDEDYSKFYKGNTYRIPYGQPVYSGRYIGYGASIDTFLSAANDASSIFYTQKSTFKNCSSTYYATDCSSFVSSCWNLPAKKTTATLHEVSTYIGKINSTSINNSLKVGDALNSSSVGHVVLVTDIKYSGNSVVSIEITEQTPPEMHRATYTPSELIKEYAASYSIYRYASSAESGGSSINANLEEVTGGYGTVSVKGWSFDSSSTSTSTEVHVYVGGPAGSGEGKPIKANLYRPDVDDVHGSGDYHGFQATISTTKRGKQPVYVYAISADGKSNVLLGGNPTYVTISEKPATSNNPINNLEILSAGENSVRVKGWAFDKDDTSKALEIHVYVGGEAGSANAKGYIVKANVSRPDVNNVYKCGSNHGFDSTITTDKVGSQPVYVYAINIGSGSNICIGNKTLTITDTTKPVVSDVKVVQSDAKSVTISCTVKDKALNKVHMYAWYTSDKNGTQKSYNAKISGTTATYTIPIADLGDKSGNYTVHVYAYDTKENYGTGALTFDFYNPTGTLDSASGGAGTVSVRGWAFDKNDTSKPVEVNVYIGGDAGTGEGHAFLANTSRPDVNKVHGCGDNHGFSATLATKKTGKQDVYVYIHNIGHGGVKLLKKETVTITADTTKPTIKNTKVSSFDSSSFTVSANVSDNVKVAKASFAVWLDGDKDNTIKWFSGTVENGVASCKIKRNDVSNKQGKFIVHVYAYDTTGNYAIGNTEFKHYMPTGSVEVFQGGTNSIKVKGWAYDQSDLSKPVQVLVTINANGKSEEYTISANKLREDINTKYGCGKYHGFEATINTKLVGTAYVTVLAKNIDSGTDKSLTVGNLTITDAPSSDNSIYIAAPIFSDGTEWDDMYFVYSSSSNVSTATKIPMEKTDLVYNMTGSATGVITTNANLAIYKLTPTDAQAKAIDAANYTGFINKKGTIRTNFVWGNAVTRANIDKEGYTSTKNTVAQLKGKTFVINSSVSGADKISYLGYWTSKAPEKIVAKIYAASPVVDSTTEMGTMYFRYGTSSTVADANRIKMEETDYLYTASNLSSSKLQAGEWAVYELGLTQSQADAINACNYTGFSSPYGATIRTNYTYSNSVTRANIGKAGYGSAKHTITDLNGKMFFITGSAAANTTSYTGNWGDYNANIKTVTLKVAAPVKVGGKTVNSMNIIYSDECAPESAKVIKMTKTSESFKPSKIHTSLISSSTAWAVYEVKIDANQYNALAKLRYVGFATSDVKVRTCYNYSNNVLRGGVGSYVNPFDATNFTHPEELEGRTFVICGSVTTKNTSSLNGYWK